jgi:hypothetical protein
MHMHKCAPSIVGSVKGFVSRAKKENETIMSTHCFLHRESLIAKAVGQGVNLF